MNLGKYFMRMEQVFTRDVSVRELSQYSLTTELKWNVSHVQMHKQES